MHLVKYLSFSILFYLSYSQVTAQLKPGNLFPSWSEGYLDIHLINTGKGESTFFIFPDSTTMIVDAGEALSEKPWATDPKPNGSKMAGEWIARYISHMISHFPKQRLNYMMISHFHWDHMGGVSDKTTHSKNGQYMLSGITSVGDRIPFDKMIDRNWPTYNWPVALNDEKMENYKKFLNWHIKNNGVKAEKLKEGHNDQIVLVNTPEKYPTFEIRNIAANGLVWTGVGNNVQNHFPLLKDLPTSEYPTENKSSIAIKLSYGKFDYFTAGDIDDRDADVGGPGNYWKDIEFPIAKATGPVEVLKANHHANYDANSVNFLGILRPRIITISTWGASQPAMNIYRRMIASRTYPGERDIFATNIMEETRTAFNVDKLKSQQGHIVVRVIPGGDSYYVYVLNDDDERFEIKSIHGPYRSE